MALTEQRILKQFAILPASGAVQVQWADQILRDGKLVAETYHREVVPLGSIEGFNTIAGDLPTRLQGLHDQALAVVAARDAQLEAMRQQHRTELAAEQEKARQHEQQAAQLQARVASLEGRAPVVDAEGVRP